MIAPISSSQNVNSVKKVNQKESYSKFSKVTQYSNDEFVRTQPSFKGVTLSSLKSKHPDKSILIVKQSLKEGLQEWKDKLYKVQYQYLKDNREPWEVNLHGQKSSADLNDPLERTLMGIFTLGLTELAIAWQNSGFRSDAKDFVNNMTSLRADLESIKLNEDLQETRKATEESGYKFAYKKSIKDVIDNEIKQKIIFPMQRIVEHKPTEMPNCVMVAHSDNSTNETLVNYIKEHANGNVSTLTDEDILDALENSEDKFDQNGNWNLIHFVNMENDINPNKVENSTIASMKDIMSSTAEDYHTTLLFSTQNPKELDQIALQPHRVKKINTDSIKTVDQMKKEAIEKKLKDNSYVEETPISALNDLLYLNGINKKLKWDSSDSEYNKIKHSFNKESDNYKKYSKTIDKIFESLDVLY